MPSFLIDEALGPSGLVGVSLVLNSMPPHHRPFALNDPALAYPYVATETISDSMLIIISTVIPIVASTILSFLLVPGSWKARAREAHTAFVGILMSVGVAMLTTNTTRPVRRQNFTFACLTHCNQKNIAHVSTASFLPRGVV